MKYLIGLVLITLSFHCSAQVKGNKKITTKVYDVSKIRSIHTGIYAEIAIDCSLPEGITITADENLQELIDRSIEDGTLTLVQKEWIEPSQQIKITIGAPNLESIQHGVHETVEVKNIDQQSFRATALLGRIKLSGKVMDFSAGGESGEVDARGLEATNVNVNLWDWGKIRLNTPSSISGSVKEGVVTYEGGTPKIDVRTSKGGQVKSVRQIAAAGGNPKTKFIDLKIKNNSSKRINAFVRGPKPDGSRFSYGFPLRAGQVKKERWTVGTKVFLVTDLGTRKKLVEIQEQDENQVVKLY